MQFQYLHYVAAGVRFNNKVVDYGRWVVSLSDSPEGLEPMAAGDKFDGFYGDSFAGTENEQFWHAIHSMTVGEGKTDGTPVILPPSQWLLKGDETEWLAMKAAKA